MLRELKVISASQEEAEVYSSAQFASDSIIKTLFRLSTLNCPLVMQKPDIGTLVPLLPSDSNEPDSPALNSLRNTSEDKNSEQNLCLPYRR